LERWTAGMHHFVVFLNNDILFQKLSLQITFFHVFLPNTLRQVIRSYQNEGQPILILWRRNYFFYFSTVCI